MVKIGDFEVLKEEVECLGEQLLISEPPSGNLILGDRTLEEIEEEKKQFNKLKLLEEREKMNLYIKELNSVQPMEHNHLNFMIRKDRDNAKR